MRNAAIVPLAIAGVLLSGCALFDPGRAHLRWQTEIGSRNMHTPAVAPDGMIYVSTGDGIWGLDSTGAIKCSIPGSGNSGALAIASSSRIYEVKYEELVRLAALDPLSGQKVWECVVDTGQPWRFQDLAPALGGDGTVYVPGCSSMVAVNPDGGIRWRCPTGSELREPPVLGADGTIYVTTVVGCLAIGPDGSVRWRYSVPGVRESGPMAIGEDGVIYMHCFSGPVVALNPDGTERWVSPVSISLDNPPVIDGSGMIYLGDGLDTLFCLNQDGTLHWQRHNYPAPAGSCVIGADGNVYFAGNTGGWWTEQEYHIVAFSPEGRKLWEYSEEGGAESDPCLGPNNALLVSRHNRGVSAFSVSSTGGGGQWPMYQHDRAHTGRAGK